MFKDPRAEHHNRVHDGLDAGMQPGNPISNVCFKVYGYMSMAQAVFFLADFKLGHYMKFSPKSMFLVQALIIFLSESKSSKKKKFENYIR